jgi:hypothetical protein
MSTKRFVISLTLALAVLLAFNLFLQVKVDSVPGMIMRQMRAMPKIDVLLVGNSLVQVGFDSKALVAAWPSSRPVPAIINTGLSSTTPVEHFLMAREAYLHHTHIRCLVYGFYDLILTEPPTYIWPKMVGNRSMDFLPKNADLTASFYAPGSDWEKWRFRMTGAIPMVRERSQLWKFVKRFRTQLDGMGMPPVPDFTFPLPASTDPLFQECESHVHRSAPLIPPIQMMFDLARHDGTQVFIVEMPMNSEKRARIGTSPAWRDYRAYLQRTCETGGAVYVNASDWIPDDKDFADNLHLGPSGAATFSTKMAQIISASLPGN